MDLAFDVDHLIKNRGFCGHGHRSLCVCTRACTRSKLFTHFLLLGSLEITSLLENADAIRCNNGPYFVVQYEGTDACSIIALFRLASDEKTGTREGFLPPMICRMLHTLNTPLHEK